MKARKRTGEPLLTQGATIMSSRDHRHDLRDSYGGPNLCTDTAIRVFDRYGLKPSKQGSS